MIKNPKINDNEVLKLIDRVQNDDPMDENLVKECMHAYLKLALDTRQFLRKIYKNMNKQSKVYSRPTNNSQDIIVGK